VGMRERAAKIRAVFDCQSSANTGTTIRVSVPARFAYSNTGVLRGIFMDCRRWFAI
jgi:hypothetical protein